MTIAICEDDEAILEILSLSLEPTKYKILKSTSMKEILSIVSSVKLDLIVLDYWIKNARADQVIAKLRTSRLNQKTPVLLISALPDLKDIGSRLAVHSTMQKPFDIANFQAKIANILTNEKNSYSRG